MLFPADYSLHNFERRLVMHLPLNVRSEGHDSGVHNFRIFAARLNPNGTYEIDMVAVTARYSTESNDALRSIERVPYMGSLEEFSRWLLARGYAIGNVGNGSSQQAFYEHDCKGYAPYSVQTDDMPLVNIDLLPITLEVKEQYSERLWTGYYRDAGYNFVRLIYGQQCQVVSSIVRHAEEF